MRTLPMSVTKYEGWWTRMQRLTALRRVSAFLLVPFVTGLVGCSRNPSLEISGSFFPAWMLCIGIGLVVTLIAKRIFLATRIDGYLTPHLVVYGAFMICATLLAWLILYL